MTDNKYLEIIGDDQFYLNWLVRNPDGYVVNCRTTKDSYRVLHRSTCRHISLLSSSASSGGFTERHYIKVCATTVEALKKWSFDNGATQECFSSICKHCVEGDLLTWDITNFASLVTIARQSTPETRTDKIREYDGVVFARTVETKIYSRSPEIVAETLIRANGICEECGCDAPFKRKSDNTPYLEVHHVKLLSEGGLDLLSNTKALCPNCHRKAHFG
ncbi:HNH endonuclease [Vibrio breoganii]